MRDSSYLLRAAAVAVLLATLGTPARAQVGVPDSVDHYKVYTVDPHMPDLNQFVQLQDQFGPQAMFVHRVDKWSNPVNKNNEGMFRPDRHYAWYLVTPPVPAPPPVTYNIIVGNQFGQGQNWKITNPHWLMAPSSKNDPVGVVPDGDHYLCYDVVQAQYSQRGVQMQDQFGPRSALVDSAECFCNPVLKQHNGVPYGLRYPLVHLACYRIAPRQQYTFGILISDQFQNTTIPLVEDCWLCLPSTKQVVTGVNQSTWGRLRELYQ